MEVPNPFKRNKTDDKEEDKHHEEKEEEPQTEISKDTNFISFSNASVRASIKNLMITFGRQHS